MKSALHQVRMLISSANPKKVPPRFLQNEIILNLFPVFVNPVNPTGPPVNPTPKTGTTIVRFRRDYNKQLKRFVLLKIIQLLWIVSKI